MRIIVAASSEQLGCPFCHDQLGPPIATCSGCRTSYHVECARSVVRCALLGCDGSLGVAPGDDVRFAIVLVPPADAGASHEAALVAALAFSAFDARQRLASRVPVIAGWVARPRVEAVLDALEAAKLEAFAIDPRALPVRQPFVVRSIQREGERLLLRSTRHEKHELALAAPRFVVTGRQATVVERTGHGDRQRANAGIAQRVHARDTMRFAHVWLPGERSPLAFEQGEIADYTFLGPLKAPSGYENMRLLCELLAQGQPSDASLEPLGDTHLQAGASAPGSATYSNRTWVLATSRLIAHARAPWLAAGPRP